MSYSRTSLHRIGRIIMLCALSFGFAGAGCTSKPEASTPPPANTSMASPGTVAPAAQPAATGAQPGGGTSGMADHYKGGTNARP